ncbi:MAG: hypothetical protein M3Z14_07850 [Candidatus Eremiobacteraeota bacterium]|nr:hypothetical protein [Candidatus Eremiobacteraeota bacterium]
MHKPFAKVFFAAAMAVGLLASSVLSAVACTNLSTLTGSLQGERGSGVTLTGHGFDTGSNPIMLHWGSLQGPVLAQGHADAFGNFKTTFQVPKDIANGSYVIIATQADKTGQPVFGTPARLSFQVGFTLASAGHHAAPGLAGAPVNAPVAATVANQPMLPAWIGSITLIALLGVLVFGIGVMLFAQEVRRAHTLVPVR